jgi:hypothetical protein
MTYAAGTNPIDSRVAPATPPAGTIASDGRKSPPISSSSGRNPPIVVRVVDRTWRSTPLIAPTTATM